MFLLEVKTSLAVPHRVPAQPRALQLVRVLHLGGRERERGEEEEEDLLTVKKERERKGSERGRE